MEPKLNYSKKETWTESNLPRIALALGYVLNERFGEVFHGFITTVVTDAKIANYLFIVAQNAFSQVQPPLEKIKDR